MRSHRVFRLFLLLVFSLLIIQSGKANSLSASLSPTAFPRNGTPEVTPPPIQSNPGMDLSIQSQVQPQDAATVLQTLYVLANGNEVKTNFSLHSGTIYTIRASGLWVWGRCDSYYCPGAQPTYIRWGDAAYLTDDHFNHFSDPAWSSWIYLEINGVRANFGSYHNDHVYTTQIVGNGTQAKFKIQDCPGCYLDNAGSLRLEIFEGSTSIAVDDGVKSFLQRSQRNPTDPDYEEATWTWGEDFMQGVPEDKEYLCETRAQTWNTKFCTYGCLVTSWAMLIDRWGQQYNFHTSPRELNKWLCENDGYIQGSANRVPHKPAEYVRKMTGRPFVDFIVPGQNPTRLHNLIYAGNPVILNLGGHFVLATGEKWSGQNKTWFVNDPGGCGVDIFTFPLTTLQQRYGNTYQGQEWGYELTGGGVMASLSIGLASPAELLITDPSGLRTGLDPRTGDTYNENPSAYYFNDQISADDGSSDTTPLIKWFDTTSPANGNYLIQVIGTGSGPYHLYLQMYDDNGDPTSLELGSQIVMGQVDTYSLNYSVTPGSQPSIARVVPVDIKPGSDPNSINCSNSNEVITVAILSTNFFDAQSVDYASVTFEEAKEIHVDEKTGMPRRHVEDVDGDGDLDLVFHFRLGDTSLTCSSSSGTISGFLSNGTAFTGTDTINMVGQ